MDKLGNRTIAIVRSGDTVSYDVNRRTNRYTNVGGNTLTYDKAGRKAEKGKRKDYE